MQTSGDSDTNIVGMATPSLFIPPEFSLLLSVPELLLHGESLECFVLLCDKKCASVLTKLQFQASFSTRNNRVTFAVVFKKKKILSRLQDKDTNLFGKTCFENIVISFVLCSRIFWTQYSYGKVVE